MYLSRGFPKQNGRNRASGRGRLSGPNHPGVLQSARLPEALFPKNMELPTQPPNLLDHLDQALRVARLPRMGLGLDFDGTIAEIAPTPDAAEVSPGCARALESLSRKLALVAVVSGRSATELRDKVDVSGLLYVGNHGAEYLDRGGLSVAPGAEAYREAIEAVLDFLKADADGPGIIWEDKRLGASVHYRLSPNPDETRRRLASALASAPRVAELETFWGKMLLELRAPVGLNKGFAVRKLAEDSKLGGVIFLGDDVTDVDALRAVRELRSERGLQGLRVAVFHDDIPSELLEVADYALNGVPGVEAFLTWLDSVTG